MEITQLGQILTFTSQVSTTDVYVHLVQQVTSLDKTLLTALYPIDNISEYTLESDGYFEITELIIDSAGEYYINGGSLYSSAIELIPDADILGTDFYGTNVTISTDKYFSYTLLQENYLTLLQKKFLGEVCGCGCSLSGNDKQVIDTILMGTEVLNILVDTEQFYEALRILGNLSGCTINTNTSNCNCYD